LAKAAFKLATIHGLKAVANWETCFAFFIPARQPTGLFRQDGYRALIATAFRPWTKAKHKMALAKNKTTG